MDCRWGFKAIIYFQSDWKVQLDGIGRSNYMVFRLILGWPNWIFQLEFAVVRRPGSVRKWMKTPVPVRLLKGGRQRSTRGTRRGFGKPARVQGMDELAEDAWGGCQLGVSKRGW